MLACWHLHLTVWPLVVQLVCVTSRHRVRRSGLHASSPAVQCSFLVRPVCSECGDKSFADVRSLYLAMCSPCCLLGTRAEDGVLCLFLAGEAYQASSRPLISWFVTRSFPSLPSRSLSLFFDVTCAAPMGVSRNEFAVAGRALTTLRQHTYKAL